MRCSVVSESSFTPSLSFVPPSWRDEETGTIVSTLRLAFLRFPFSEIPRTKSWTFWIASSGVHRLLSVQTEEEISFGCASKPRRSLLRLESITMSAMLNKKNSVNRFIFWLLFDFSYSDRFSDTPPVSQLVWESFLSSGTIQLLVVWIEDNVWPSLKNTFFRFELWLHSMYHRALWYFVIHWAVSSTDP